MADSTIAIIDTIADGSRSHNGNMMPAPAPQVDTTIHRAQYVDAIATNGTAEDGEIDVHTNTQVNAQSHCGYDQPSRNGHKHSSRSHRRSRSPKHTRRPHDTQDRYHERRDRHNSSSRHDYGLHVSSDVRSYGGSAGSTINGARPAVYVPPYRMRQMLAANNLIDHNSEQYQRLQFDTLRKSINGIINKVNTDNIQYVVTEIFDCNIIRGRGLLCNAIYRAQSISNVFTNVYACLIAVINTKIPEIGELMCKRLITTYQRAYRHNDKPALISSTLFIAHMTNQYVLHELVALQILTQLLDKSTNQSVEIAIQLVEHVGQRLTEVTPAGMNTICDTFRRMLHSGVVDERVQYQIEKLFDVRRADFKQYPAVAAELDLVEANDQITHELSLDEKYNTETTLDTYQYDNQYDMHEQQYDEIKRDIVGDADDTVGEDADDGTAGTHADNTQLIAQVNDVTDVKPYHIDDQTSGDQIALRRTIYLTIMSSLNYEECVHKLLKHIKNGQEKVLCEMLLECCSVERTYLRFYGLIAERLCRLKRVYAESFDELFATYYSTAHRYETKKLRNVAKLYGHLLYADVIEWSVLEYIMLTENDTTSAGRIFVKILFRDLSEQFGLVQLKDKLDGDNVKRYTHTIFNTDNPKNTRFSINYFTSIGLGLLSETLRAHLAAQPQRALADQIAAVKAEYSTSSSDSGSDSSTSSDSDTSSSSSDYSSTSTSSSGSSRITDSSRSRSHKRRRRRSRTSHRSKRNRTDTVHIKSEPTAAI